jgi:hypothetical protein
MGKFFHGGNIVFSQLLSSTSSFLSSITPKKLLLLSLFPASLRSQPVQQFLPGSTTITEVSDTWGIAIDTDAVTGPFGAECGAAVTATEKFTAFSCTDANNLAGETFFVENFQLTAGNTSTADSFLQLSGKQVRSIECLEEDFFQDDTESCVLATMDDKAIIVKLPPAAERNALTHLDLNSPHSSLFTIQDPESNDFASKIVRHSATQNTITQMPSFSVLDRTGPDAGNNGRAYLFYSGTTWQTLPALTNISTITSTYPTTTVTWTNSIIHDAVVWPHANNKTYYTVSGNNNGVKGTALSMIGQPPVVDLATDFNFTISSPASAALAVGHFSQKPYPELAIAGNNIVRIVQAQENIAFQSMLPISCNIGSFQGQPLTQFGFCLGAGNLHNTQVIGDDLLVCARLFGNPNNIGAMHVFFSHKDFCKQTDMDWERDFSAGSARSSITGDASFDRCVSDVSYTSVMAPGQLVIGCRKYNSEQGTVLILSQQTPVQIQLGNITLTQNDTVTISTENLQITNSNLKSGNVSFELVLENGDFLNNVANPFSLSDLPISIKHDGSTQPLAVSVTATNGVSIVGPAVFNVNFTLLPTTTAAPTTTTITTTTSSTSTAPTTRFFTTPTPSPQVSNPKSTTAQQPINSPTHSQEDEGTNFLSIAAPIVSITLAVAGFYYKCHSKKKVERALLTTQMSQIQGKKSHPIVLLIESEMKSFSLDSYDGGNGKIFKEFVERLFTTLQNTVSTPNIKSLLQRREHIFQDNEQIKNIIDAIQESKNDAEATQNIRLLSQNGDQEVRKLYQIVKVISQQLGNFHTKHPHTFFTILKVEPSKNNDILETEFIKDTLMRLKPYINQQEIDASIFTDRLTQTLYAAKADNSFSQVGHLTTLGMAARHV